ncbi:MAG: hypothetical protein K2K57_02000 [Oscillospiraceae bacterium]|nr:hypothetical protein [Oscillospiraceae bacterium]
MAQGMTGVSADELINNDYSKYNNNAIKTDVDPNDPSNSYMDFEGYLKLLSAQMSNQDFNNSMSDSEFIQQMASYSMMEAISQMNKQSQLTYSASLIGKAVTVTDESGAPDTGIVEAVTMTEKGCNILINGNQYPSSKITDVVDGDIYSSLNLFTGHKVEVEVAGDDGTTTASGTVTSVYISNGQGYVVLDKRNTYPLAAISKIIDDNPDHLLSRPDGSSGRDPSADGDVPAPSEGTDNSSSPENAGDAAASGSDNSQGTENADNSGVSAENAAALQSELEAKLSSSAVNESAAASASGTVYRGVAGVTSKKSRNADERNDGSNSNSGFDTLLDMLDGTSAADGRGLMSYASAAVRSNLEAIASRRIAQVEEPVAASGVSSDSDRVPAPSVYNQYITGNSANNNTESNNTVGNSAGASRTNSTSSRMPAPSAYNSYVSGNTTRNTANNANSANNAGASSTNTAVGGVTSQNNLTGGNRVSSRNAKSTYDTGAQYGSISVSDMDAAARNLETYTNSGSTVGSSYAGTRSYAPEYVLEAAFADSVGTRMGDIRYIGNTDIMNRIDTSEVIAYTQKGRAVTDIGWCGKGRLGEVLTFPDGKQRVEVILGDDISYFYTTGNYTLNELFNKNVPAGYWVDKTTPQERALMHYAEEYTPAEKAEMEAFEQYCVRHAATMLY